MRVFKVILLSLVALSLVSMPILAAVAYRASYSITETNGTAYTMLPVIELVDNEWMADNGFMQDDALDTRIETLGGSTKPHMVADNKTLTAVPIPADSQTNLYFTTANTDLSSLDIITGYDGYITIADAATLELAADFEVEQSGYVDTDAGTGKNLVYKEAAYRTYISAEDSIAASIAGGGLDFPSVGAVNGGNNVVAAVNHTVNLPAGIAAYDLLLVFFVADGNDNIGFPTGWTELFDSVSAATVTFAGAYRTADGDEAATITVTTGNVTMSAHTSYLVTGNWSVPEVGAATTGLAPNEPNSPNLAPSWGAENTLWFTACGYDENRTINAYPANYGDGRNDFANNAAGCGVGSARRELNAAAEDPGDFTMSVIDHWVANTIAVAPIQSVIATPIASGEYTVKTYGVANEPDWATGDVLHFTGAADSNVNAGAINDNIAKLWVSLWFKLDSTFSVASATDQFIWGKFNGAADYVYAYLESDDGILYFNFDDGVNPFSLASTTVSWTVDTWYHIITSLSDTGPAQRLLVNGTAEDTDAVAASNTPNGGDFCFGDFDDPGAVTGFIGEIQNVIIGVDNLSIAEETSLYAGTAPGDETDYWYADEGTGTNIVSYGTAANAGTADAAPTWETATFSTGKTGRLCDFYIEVDDGVTDPDRWGANLKGASVPANANDWLLNQNNVMPYMDYYKHTVSGVEHAWYQPNYMVEATDSGGTETAGGSDVLITAAEITEGVDYWVGGLVTITAAAGAAPEGEARVCTASAVGTITVTVPFSANVDIGDTFTVDFGTLIDRSYYGLDFNGTTDFVDCGNDASLISPNQYSMEAWVRVDTTVGTRVAFGLSNVADFPGFAPVWGANTSYLNLGVNWYREWDHAPVDVTDGSVHHLVVVVDDTDPSACLLYADGQLQTVKSTVSTGAATVKSRFILSATNNGTTRFLDGYMDEVRFYDRMLGSTEIEANYNSGAGSYTPYSTTGLVGEWHIEEGSGVAVADTSGEGNNGTITGADWADGHVPRPAGNSGTNDSRVTWGANPTGIGVTLGGMVSETQPVPGIGAEEAAQGILPETEVSDWYVDPDITGSLLTNPLRPFVTMVSDNVDISEVLVWRLYAAAIILFFTVGALVIVRGHLLIAGIACGASILGMVVLTIYPIWTLIFAIGAVIVGLISERSQSL